MTTAPTTPVWRLPGMPALLAATVAGFSGFSALMPVAPLWVSEGGASTAGAGAVNGVLMLFTVLTQPFVPAAVRRWGWGPIMAAGQLLLGLPALAHLLSADLAWVLLLAAVRGLGFGILTVTGSAAVANLVDPRRRGAAVGIYGLAIAAPQVAFMPIGPWVVQEAAYWPMFLAGALPLLGVVPAWLTGRVLFVEPDTAAPATHSRTQVYRHLIRAMLLLLGVTLAGGALITFSSDLAPAAWLATAALLVLTGAAAITRWRTGVLADRFGTRPFLAPLVVLTSVGLGLVALSLSRSGGTAAGLMLLGVLCVGISYGALQNLTLVLAFASVTRRDYGTASAVWNIGFDLGTGLGSVLVGAIAAGASFSQALLVAAALSLATLPLALVRKVRNPSVPGQRG